ncbi:DUF1636 domain-containing protein [Abyssibius alkaniclasticus]|uniref:DUF1636 domain-containing protein n=1 Tax=Abyssibius alkaniclasticus TaxID=2881234 RepID=UPI0023645F15|nr:DUF1636 domain-containing protein [Abyssibius alkaniclasticus]UPH72319.1 DUF1636 domain-containing protein [Abyssibius alkaniclasticus]
MTTTILVCDTCRFSAKEKLCGDKTGGEILGDHIAAALPEGVKMRRHSCLMGCDHHCNLAIRAPGKLTYVLGAFEPTAESAAAVVEFAAKFDESETGRVPFKEWPVGVKGHFVSRMPPIEEDG